MNRVISDSVSITQIKLAIHLFRGWGSSQTIRHLPVVRATNMSSSKEDRVNCKIGEEDSKDDAKYNEKGERRDERLNSRADL